MSIVTPLDDSRNEADFLMQFENNFSCNMAEVTKQPINGKWRVLKCLPTESGVLTSAEKQKLYLC